MSLTLYVVLVWQFFYEVKSCRILKNLWVLTSYKNCDSKELASREWVNKLINLNLVDIRFSFEFSYFVVPKMAVFQFLLSFWLLFWQNSADFEILGFLEWQFYWFLDLCSSNFHILKFSKWRIYKFWLIFNVFSSIFTLKN